MVKGSVTMPSEKQLKELMTISPEISWNSDIHFHVFEGNSDGREFRLSLFNFRGKISA